MQRQRAAHHQEKCMARRLRRTLRVVVRYTMRMLTGRRVNLQKFQAAILRHLQAKACFQSSWLSVSQISTRVRRLQTLTDTNEHVYEAVMEVPEDLEVANSWEVTSEIIEDVMSNVQADDDVLEVLREDAGDDLAITDVTVVSAAANTEPADAKLGTNEEKSDDGSSDAHLIIGIVMGVIGLCGVGAAVALYVKRMDSNAIAMQRPACEQLAEIGEVCTPKADSVELKDNSEQNNSEVPTKVKKPKGVGLDTTSSAGSGVATAGRGTVQVIQTGSI